MCVMVPPAVAMGVMAATTAIGAGLSAYGAIQNASAQEAAANYQAAVARNNQIIANQNAEAALQAGAVQEQQSRLKTAALIGAQRAALAANGVDPNSGSGADLQASAAEMGEEDALTIRNNAARQAYNYQVQGMSDQAQEQLDIMQGKSAAAAGTIGAFSSLLSGASTISSAYTNWQLRAGSNGGVTSNPAVH